MAPKRWYDFVAALSDEDKARAMVLAGRSAALTHAVQSGVSLMEQYNPASKETKHLRVGIDTSKADMSALVHLLAQKGLITEIEYLEAQVDGLEREVQYYRDTIAAHLGTDPDKISLL